MKNIHKSAIALVLIAALSSTLLACTGGEGPGEGNIDIDFFEYETSTIEFTDNSSAGQYNKDLWYRNDLTLDMGDPMVVYEDGYFYAYGTRGGSGFTCYRSTNLSDWESMGTVFQGTVPSDADSLGLWAPDLQKIGDSWYLYYTVNINFADRSKDYCMIGVAKGPTPHGPFTQVFDPDSPEGYTLANTPFSDMTQGDAKSTILDEHVFEDDNGKLYMYFSYDCSKNPYDPDHYDEHGASIWGVEMKSPTEWDITTLTQLVRPGYKRVDDLAVNIPWENWSPSFAGPTECAEGPYMLKHGDKYYLTYCANSFVDTEYAVGYAVSDSPLGPFVKPNDTYLENMLLGVPGQTGTYINNRYKGFMTGTGHASIVKIGNELMFAYHAHMMRMWDPSVTHGDWRALAFDYIYFDDAGKPYTNGPTWSLNRLPEEVSGYRNLAAEATIRIQGENPEYLNDNFTNRGINTDEVGKEAQFKAGRRSIELTFAKPVTVKAVNVYNSYDYTKRTETISQIDFGNGKGIVNVQFNRNYLNTAQTFIFPHSAYNVELTDEIVTDRIVITFDSLWDFAVGEIEILGR